MYIQSCLRILIFFGVMPKSRYIGNILTKPNWRLLRWISISPFSIKVELASTNLLCCFNFIPLEGIAGAIIWLCSFLTFSTFTLQAIKPLSIIKTVSLERSLGYFHPFLDTVSLPLLLTKYLSCNNRKLPGKSCTKCIAFL